MIEIIIRHNVTHNDRDAIITDDSARYSGRAQSLNDSLAALHEDVDAQYEKVRALKNAITQLQDDLQLTSADVLSYAIRTIISAVQDIAIEVEKERAKVGAVLYKASPDAQDMPVQYRLSPIDVSVLTERMHTLETFARNLWHLHEQMEVSLSSEISGQNMTDDAWEALYKQ